jgi:hypothetical protein
MLSIFFTNIVLFYQFFSNSVNIFNLPSYIYIYIYFKSHLNKKGDSREDLISATCHSLFTVCHTELRKVAVSSLVGGEKSKEQTPAARPGQADHLQRNKWLEVLRLMGS